jgi:nitric oxide reductase NorQ protein
MKLKSLKSASGVSPFRIEEYRVEEEPYYVATGEEIDLFRAAYENQIPVLLKGPTGCGKTRFMEYMAWQQQRPLVTVSCHDDLTAADLVGRYLIKGGETVWVDGPLARAVRAGALCYLDEIVEARKDTTVVIHPLTDSRRILPLEKRGEVLVASTRFHLTISYNPGYQSVLKNLKQSTRQRFLAIDFSYPAPELEKNIVMHESEVNEQTATRLVKFAGMTRNLKEHGLEEGASTRLLVHAGKLISSGVEPLLACNTAVAASLTDDQEMLLSMREMLTSLF